MADANFPGWKPEKTIHMVTGEGMTRLFVKGRLYMSWRCGDEECLRWAMGQLHTHRCAHDGGPEPAHGRASSRSARRMAASTWRRAVAPNTARLLMELSGVIFA